MENLLENTVIQLLGIIIGGLLAIASAYATLFVAKATQKAKVEIEKLNDEYRYHLVLSSKKVKLLSFLISETIKNLTPIYGVRLESDIDPDDLL